MRGFCLAMAAVMLGSGAVSAATLNEGIGASEFSGDWRNPTVVAAGHDTVSGTWGSRGDHDILAFTALKKAAQTVTLTFSPTTPIGERDWSFSAGGQVLYKFSPLQYSGHEGTKLPNVNIRHGDSSKTVSYTLSFDKDFGGILYLMLFSTHTSRDGLTYNIAVPGNAVAETQPAPVPLPAGMALLPAGLAALAFLRRRKAR